MLSHVPDTELILASALYDTELDGALHPPNLLTALAPLEPHLTPLQLLRHELRPPILMHRLLPLSGAAPALHLSRLS